MVAVWLAVGCACDSQRCAGAKGYAPCRAAYCATQSHISRPPTSGPVSVLAGAGAGADSTHHSPDLAAGGSAADAKCWSCSAAPHHRTGKISEVHLGIYVLCLGVRRTAYRRRLPLPSKGPGRLLTRTGSTSARLTPSANVCHLLLCPDFTGPTFKSLAYSCMLNSLSSHIRLWTYHDSERLVLRRYAWCARAFYLEKDPKLPSAVLSCLADAAAGLLGIIQCCDNSPQVGTGLKFASGCATGSRKRTPACQGRRGMRLRDTCTSTTMVVRSKGALDTVQCHVSFCRTSRAEYARRP